MFKIVAGSFATSLFGGVREVLRADLRRRPRCDGGFFIYAVPRELRL
jgi:hypothetical protein